MTARPTGGQFEELYRRALAEIARLTAVEAEAMEARDIIRELEAANAVGRRDIEALMRSADSLEARNTELEAQVVWSAARIAELEAEVEQVEDRRAEDRRGYDA